MITYYQWARMHILSPYLVFFDIIPLGVLKYLPRPLWGWEFRFPIWPLLTWIKVDHSFFCDVWQQQNSYYLEVLDLAKPCFPDLSARESRLFLEQFFFPLCLLVFLHCWFLQQQVWDVGGRRKSKESTIISFFTSQGPRFFSLPFRVFICFM